MAPRLKQGLTVAAAVGAAAIGGTAIAGATGDRSTSTTGNRAGERPPYGAFPGGPPGRHGHARGGPGGPGRGERPLTGATAEKVEAAALARVKGGTVLRVETDRGGVYEAHVRRADGTEVEVKVNRSFKVTAVEEHQRPERRP